MPEGTLFLVIATVNLHTVPWNPINVFSKYYLYSDYRNGTYRLELFFIEACVARYSLHTIMSVRLGRMNPRDTPSIGLTVFETLT